MIKLINILSEIRVIGGNPPKTVKELKKYLEFHKERFIDFILNKMNKNEFTRDYFKEGWLEMPFQYFGSRVSDTKGVYLDNGEGDTLFISLEPGKIDPFGDKDFRKILKQDKFLNTTIYWTYD